MACINYKYLHDKPVIFCFVSVLFLFCFCLVLFFDKSAAVMVALASRAVASLGFTTFLLLSVPCYQRLKLSGKRAPVAGLASLAKVEGHRWPPANA